MSGTRPLPEKEVRTPGDDKMDSNQEKSQPPTRRSQAVRTALVFLSCILVGIYTNILGPSLLDIEYFTSSSTTAVTTLFIWRHGGYLIGSLLSGPFVDHLNEYFLIGWGFIVMATCVAISPWWPKIMIFSLMFAVGGIANCICVVSFVVAIIRIWASDAAPFQQANFLCLNIGTVIAPQLFKPFLSSRHTSGEGNSTHDYLGANITMDNDTYSVHLSNYTRNINDTMDVWKPVSTVKSTIDILKPVLIMNDTIDILEPLTIVNGTIDILEPLTIVNGTIDNLKPVSQEDNSGMFAYGYVITAVCLLCGSLINFSIVAYDRCQLRIRKAKTIKTVKSMDKIEGVAKFLVLLLQFFLGFIMSAIEETYAGLLISFLVKYLGLSESISTDMVTVYFAASATSRCLGILFAKFIRASRSLAIEVLLIVLGYVLLTFALHLHWTIPWMSATLIGLGFGAFYPNMINWANSCMHLRGRETSVIFFSVAAGKMISPFLVGYIFEEYGPKWFVYMGFIYSMLLTCVYILKYVTVHCFLRKLKKVKYEEVNAMETIISKESLVG